MIASPRAALARALDVLEGAADVVRERVSDERAPSWADGRGWTEALDRLSDRELQACEEQGLCRVAPDLPGMPASLVDLALAVTAATELPSLDTDDREPPLRTGVGARKRHQLAALLDAIAPMAAHKRRVVDIGAGKGHFSRAASEALAKEVLGLDRDPARVRAAIDLSAPDGRATFLRLDVFSEALPLGPDDLAVGLHACGEVGDRTAAAAAEAGSDLALVSCCLQKIQGDLRPPLSLAARARGAELPRQILGLSNLTARAAGVERSLSETNRAREHRLALRLLLRSRGALVDHGEELRGINRRRALAGLEGIAERALEMRGLRPATAGELARAAEEAKLRFARMRRWNLPRSMLSRLIEVTVSLDRAAILEEHGLAAAVMTLVDPSVTARNIIVLASRDPARLPRSRP
ncbi:MAG TPA: methyltransferase [Polyangiaceae bacterium]|jgi:SAM-dependent methyltransferase|nr:methyltransferase [Polyangiaceae bacterium]